MLDVLRLLQTTRLGDSVVLSITILTFAVVASKSTEQEDVMLTENICLEVETTYPAVKTEMIVVT